MQIAGLPRRARYPLLPGRGIGIENLTFRGNSSLRHRCRFGNSSSFPNGLGFSCSRLLLRYGLRFRSRLFTYGRGTRRLALRLLFFSGALLRGALGRGTFFRGCFLGCFLCGSFLSLSRSRAGFPVRHRRSLPPLIRAHKIARANGGRCGAGSVLKPRFPDPGFDRLWSNRRQRVSSAHRTPSRSPSKPLHASISFRKSILQSTVCPMRAVPTAAPL